MRMKPIGWILIAYAAFFITIFTVCKTKKTDAQTSYHIMRIYGTEAALRSSLGKNQVAIVKDSTAEGYNAFVWRDSLGTFYYGLADSHNIVAMNLRILGSVTGVTNIDSLVGCDTAHIIIGAIDTITGDTFYYANGRVENLWADSLKGALHGVVDSSGGAARLDGYAGTSYNQIGRADNEWAVDTVYEIRGGNGNPAYGESNKYLKIGGLALCNNGTYGPSSGLGGLTIGGSFPFQTGAITIYSVSGGIQLKSTSGAIVASGNAIRCSTQSNIALIADTVICREYVKATNFLGKATYSDSTGGAARWLGKILSSSFNFTGTDTMKDLSGVSNMSLKHIMLSHNDTITSDRNLMGTVNPGSSGDSTVIWISATGAHAAITGSHFLVSCFSTALDTVIVMCTASAPTKLVYAGISYNSWKGRGFSNFIEFYYTGSNVFLVTAKYGGTFY